MFVKTFLPALVFALHKLFAYYGRWDKQLKENLTDTQYDALVVISGLVSDLIASITGTSLFNLPARTKINSERYKTAIAELRQPDIMPVDFRLRKAISAIRKSQSE